MEKASQRNWRPDEVLLRPPGMRKLEGRDEPITDCPRNGASAGSPVPTLPTWLKGENVLLDILVREWKAHAGGRSGQHAASRRPAQEASTQAAPRFSEPPCRPSEHSLPWRACSESKFQSQCGPVSIL